MHLRSYWTEAAGIFCRLAEGEKLAAEELQSLIDRADTAKLQKAVERLKAKPIS